MVTDGVAARLQRLEDLEEIRALFLEYGARLDALDFTGYADLFTKDGELDAQLGHARGRAEIAALLEQRLGANTAPRAPAIHLVANPVVEIEGDRGTAHVTWAYLTHDQTGKPVILQAGNYDDVLAREDGRWRFVRRRISRSLGVSPLD